jgi:hypothetical protein
LVHTADDHRIILLALRLGNSLVVFARNDELERDNQVCSLSCTLPTRVSDRTMSTHGRYLPVVQVAFVLHVSLTFGGLGSGIKVDKSRIADAS